MNRVKTKATTLVAMLGLIFVPSTGLAQVEEGLLEFDPSIDEELADFILEREAELAGVQTRGTTLKSSRSRILGSATKTGSVSVQEFRRQTRTSGLRVVIDHIEAVRKGAQPNAEFVAKSLLDFQAANPNHDIMARLFYVFRESIQEANEDKRVWLLKLKKYNEIAEALGDYLKDLNDAMASASDDDSDSGSGSGCGDDSGPREIPNSLVDEDHRVLAAQMLERRAWLDGYEGMAQTKRQLQQMKDQVQARRQMASKAFQNFDQKSNQLYNLLSSVMKAMNEMRMGTQRNML